MGQPRGEIVFITGTDTGVGKTLFTRLSLEFLRGRGEDAVALKPFCSGGRSDALELLGAMENRLSLDEINPNHIAEPIAPGVKKGHRRPQLSEVVGHIRGISRRFSRVLVEGVGGVLVPLTPRFCVADLIKALDCDVMVVSRDQLGTLNHTLLTVSELKKRGVRIRKVVLMKKNRPDPSEKYNRDHLSHTLGAKHITSVPFLRSKKLRGASETILKKTLANIWGGQYCLPSSLRYEVANDGESR